MPDRKPVLASLKAPKAEKAEKAQAQGTVRSRWGDALESWRSENYKASHEAFAAMAKNEDGDDWSRAGAAFWAARAADRMHERRLAKGYLQLAAKLPQTFYGQLASQIIRSEPNIISRNFPMLPADLRADVQGDAALVHAIIMQESRFNGRAKSKMGAMGLMQVMPATARHIEGRSFKGNEQLFDKAYNVRVGSRYVQMLASEPSINGAPHLLLAAYNGGPGNLEKWMKAMPEDIVADPFLVIEAYPSGETRAFVERVMANMWVYEKLLNKRTSPSLQKMAALF